MAPLFDFCCDAGHRTEALRPGSVAVIDCPQCGRTAARAQVYRVAMQMGAVNDYTPLIRDNGKLRPPVNERKVSLRHWREATEQLAYEHTRAEESAQQELPTPPLTDWAKAKARRLMADGITDSLDMPKTGLP